MTNLTSPGSVVGQRNSNKFYRNAIYVHVGGETIKHINATSGAHVELQRNQGPNMNEKIFNIRGEPQQIQVAIQMICEKAGLPFQVSYSFSLAPFRQNKLVLL